MCFADLQNGRNPFKLVFEGNLFTDEKVYGVKQGKNVCSFIVFMIKYKYVIDD